VKNGSDSQFTFGVAILAAGRSQRMGRPKMLLPWGATSVLGHLLQSWKELHARQVAVVCAADARDMHHELSRLRFSPSDCIFNPAPERGMFSSIRCAASWPGWKAELTHWIITLGDQPHLRLETFRTLLDFGAAHPGNICQPLRKGKQKHPVLLPKRVFTELADSRAADLKQFLAGHAGDLAGFESDDAGLDSDMDTPEDYDRLRP